MKKELLLLLTALITLSSYANERFSYAKTTTITDTSTVIPSLTVSEFIYDSYLYNDYTVKYAVVTSNDTYVLSTSKQWLSVEQLSSDSEEAIGVLSYYHYSVLRDYQDAAENESVIKIKEYGNNVYYREGAITVTPLGGLSETIDFVQDGIFIDTRYSIYDDYELLNTGEDNDPVSIDSYSSEQGAESGRTNFAENTLDGDEVTKWSASDQNTGDYNDDGEYIIYNLGSIVNLKAIQISTDWRENPYGYQILVSETDTETTSFTKVIPETDTLSFTEAGTTTFQINELDVDAKYVKLVVFGRYTVLDDGTYSQSTTWINITRIEFLTEKEVIDEPVVIDEDSTTASVDQKFLFYTQVFNKDFKNNEYSRYVVVSSSEEVTISSQDDWISITSVDLDSEEGKEVIEGYNKYESPYFSDEFSQIIKIKEEINTDTNTVNGQVNFATESLSEDFNIYQNGVYTYNAYNLINTGNDEDPVTINSYSSFTESTGDYSYDPINTLDKDSSTRWSAEDGDILEGDYKGDGEYIIYDLGAVYTLNAIQFIDIKLFSSNYGYQFYASSSGIDEADFVKVLPDNDDISYSDNKIDYEIDDILDFHIRELSASARYIKIVAFGRFREDYDVAGVYSRISSITNLKEIEFFGEIDEKASDDDFVFSETVIFPVPANNSITLKNYTDLSTVAVLSIDGKLLEMQNIESFDSDVTLDTSRLVNGIYLLKLLNASGDSATRKIVVQH